MNPPRKAPKGGPSFSRLSAPDVPIALHLGSSDGHGADGILCSNRCKKLEITAIICYEWLFLLGFVVVINIFNNHFYVYFYGYKWL